MDNKSQQPSPAPPRRNVPPPLPPRTPSQSEPPPPYSIGDEKAARAAILREHGQSQDFGSSSNQSYSLEDEKAARAAIIRDHGQFQNLSSPIAQAYSFEDEKSAQAAIIRAQTQSQEPASPPIQSYSLAAENSARITVFNEKRSATINEQWRSNDPRSSSTQSLVPSESGRDGRRTLLNIFIHGFMGNETSFQSFPAHLHNLLTITMSETHVVHTKIYPRYKSRKPLEFARDDFSKWLEPHESSTTDVILLGHSMGGLLAAEVAILPESSPESRKALHHRILGTINFDTPFLGMHPGVIVSGIGSLFRPAAAPTGIDTTTTVGTGALSPTESQVSMPISLGSTQAPESSASGYTPDTSVSSSTQLTPVQSHASSISGLSMMPSNDPNYNPPFPNDVRQTERSGWSSVLHFISKHSDGLTTATKQYFMSHIEFGGCLADYQGLKNRYATLRSLEDVDEVAPQKGSDQGPGKQRVRFVNYYTASTGIPKKPKSPKVTPGQMTDEEGRLGPMEEDRKDVGAKDGNSHSGGTTPRISLDEYNDQGVQHREVEDGPDESPVTVRNLSEVEGQLQGQIKNLGQSSGVHDDEDELLEMRHIDSIPIPDDEEPYPPPSSPIQDPSNTNEAINTSESSNTIDAMVHQEPGFTLPRTNSEPPLPPIPAVPTEPTPIDLTAYTDKDARKIAEKEQKRVMKVYNQAIKDRENAIKDRRKLVEKREVRARKEADKALKAEQKQRLKEEKEEEKRLASLNQGTKPEPEQTERVEGERKGKEKEKSKRDKKFCMLPPNINGKIDPKWVRVYMEGVDEVGAHCGLFFAGPQYESLVGDVGARIEDWVKEDATRRLVLATEAE